MSEIDGPSAINAFVLLEEALIIRPSCKLDQLYPHPLKEERIYGKSQATAVPLKDSPLSNRVLLNPDLNSRFFREWDQILRQTELLSENQRRAVIQRLGFDDGIFKTMPEMIKVAGPMVRNYYDGGTSRLLYEIHRKVLPDQQWDYRKVITAVRNYVDNYGLNHGNH